MSTSTTNMAALLPAVATPFVVEERAVPSPGADEVLIRNHAIGLNPIDWKRQAWGVAIPSYPAVLGSAVAGVVAAVGPGVTSVQPGDRVFGSGAAMATGNTDHAAFQTYTVVSTSTVLKLPDVVTFAQATTLESFANGAIALFDTLALPLPQSPSSDTTSKTGTGILIWGGASATGSATIQLARLAGLRIFATASPAHHERIRALGAEVVVDYRSDSAAADLIAAAKQAGVKIDYAVDAVGSPATAQSVGEVLAGFEGTAKKVASVAPWPENVAKPEGLEAAWLRGDAVWSRRRDLAEWLFNRELKGWLENGTVAPLPVRVVEGGLAGLQSGLDELKKGVSGEKLAVQL